MNNINEILPDVISFNDKEAKTNEEKADLFSDFFTEKINNIVNNHKPNPNVYNGKCSITNRNVTPFSLEETIKILESLPLKNSSGYDRIPMRFFNDGHIKLAETVYSLMLKIWETEKIPFYWKITKT